MQVTIALHTIVKITIDQLMPDVGTIRMKFPAVGGCTAKASMLLI
jgi:hypothetical protein